MAIGCVTSAQRTIAGKLNGAIPAQTPAEEDHTPSTTQCMREGSGPFEQPKRACASSAACAVQRAGLQALLRLCLPLSQLPCQGGSGERIREC